MSQLTERQSQIAELAALGVSNGQIAVELGIAPEVVRAELRALYRELSGSGPSSTRLSSDPSRRAVRPEGANQ